MPAAQQARLEHRRELDSVHHAEKLPEQVGRANLCDSGPDRQLYQELLELYLQAQAGVDAHQAARVHASVHKTRQAGGRGWLQEDARQAHVALPGLHKPNCLLASPKLQEQRTCIQAAGLSEW